MERQANSNESLPANNFYEINQQLFELEKNNKNGNLLTDINKDIKKDVMLSENLNEEEFTLKKENSYLNEQKNLCKMEGLMEEGNTEACYSKNIISSINYSTVVGYNLPFLRKLNSFKFTEENELIQVLEHEFKEILLSTKPILLFGNKQSTFSCEIYEEANKAYIKLEQEEYHQSFSLEINSSTELRVVAISVFLVLLYSDASAKIEYVINDATFIKLITDYLLNYPQSNTEQYKEIIDILICIVIVLSSREIGFQLLDMLPMSCNEPAICFTDGVILQYNIPSTIREQKIITSSQEYQFLSEDLQINLPIYTQMLNQQVIRQEAIEQLNLPFLQSTTSASVINEKDFIQKKYGELAAQPFCAESNAYYDEKLIVYVTLQNEDVYITLQQGAEEQEYLLKVLNSTVLRRLAIAVFLVVVSCKKCITLNFFINYQYFVDKMNYFMQLSGADELAGSEEDEIFDIYMMLLLNSQNLVLRFNASEARIVPRNELQLLFNDLVICRPKRTTEAVSKSGSLVSPTEAQKPFSAKQNQGKQSRLKEPQEEEPTEYSCSSEPAQKVQLHLEGQLTQREQLELYLLLQKFNMSNMKINEE